MSSFTKDKLKLELAKYKIPFPKDAKKDVYVKLYQTHVANKETSEYSSDEDMSDAAVSTRKSKFVATMNGQADYTDDELRRALKEHGINAGPITGSTRNVYIRKLERLMQEPGTSNTREEPSVMSAQSVYVEHTETRTSSRGRPAEVEFSDGDEPEPAEPESEPRSRQSLRRRPMSSPRKPSPVRKREVHTRIVDQEEEEEDELDNIPPPPKPSTSYKSPAISRPVYVERRPEKPIKKPTPKPVEKKRFPIWLQIVAILLVVVIIYLFLLTLEPSGKSFVGRVTGSK